MCVCVCVCMCVCVCLCVCVCVCSMTIIKMVYMAVDDNWIKTKPGSIIIN